MNGTINLKKLSTKMLDAISTLNTRVDAVPSQIKTNNRQMLATVEQNAEASSRAYAAGEYLAVNGKLYKALNNIAQGDALEQNVNIQWVLLGDEVNKLRGDLKSGAWKDVANNLNTTTAGTNVLDAYQGKILNDSIAALGTRLTKIEKPLVLYNSGNASNVKYHTTFDLCSLNFPKNTGKWIILGCVYTNYGGTATNVVSYKIEPSQGVLTAATRTATSSGGGCIGFLYLMEYNQDRKVTLRTYCYDQVLANSATYKYTGVLWAYNLR